ncbi:MAG: ZIP family metal transporter [Clostridia bacterium]|nr:ZIP family metal transporter [Clostridia bacterium]
MDYLAIIIITFISGVIGTGLGGLVGAILRRESNKIVSLLLSFAGGIMLAVVCFDLMSQPVEMMKDGTLPSYTPVIVVLAVIVGYAVVYLLNHVIDKHANREVKHIDKDHPSTADDLDELIHADHFESHKDGTLNSKSNLFVAGLVMMIAIALHNLPEGMVIGASYAMEENLTANLFSSTGFIMAIVIGLHNIPEGMAVSVPLISGGMGKVKSVLLTALSGLPTVFGALLGYALGGINEIMLVLSLGFASGAMLYVVFGELLPESILMWKSKLPALAVFVGVLVGFLLVSY